MQSYTSGTGSRYHDDEGECSPSPLPQPNTEATTKVRARGRNTTYGPVAYAAVEVENTANSDDLLRLEALRVLKIIALQNGCHEFKMNGKPVARANGTCRAEFL